MSSYTGRNALNRTTSPNFLPSGHPSSYRGNSSGPNNRPLSSISTSSSGYHGGDSSSKRRSLLPPPAIDFEQALAGGGTIKISSDSRPSYDDERSADDTDLNGSGGEGEEELYDQVLDEEDEQEVINEEDEEPVEGLVSPSVSNGNGSSSSRWKYNIHNGHPLHTRSPAKTSRSVSSSSSSNGGEGRPSLSSSYPGLPLETVLDQSPVTTTPGFIIQEKSKAPSLKSSVSPSNPPTTPQNTQAPSTSYPTPDSPIVHPATPIMNATSDLAAEDETPMVMVRSEAPLPELPPAHEEEHDPLFKRRSIFRSPGTASSPDLATLVKRAKEAKAQAELHRLVGPDPVAEESHLGPEEDEWAMPRRESASDYSSGQKYGAGIGYKKKDAKSSVDGSQTLGKKARTMFGRFFSSGDKQSFSSTPPSSFTMPTPSNFASTASLSTKQSQRSVSGPTMTSYIAASPIRNNIAPASPPSPVRTPIAAHWTSSPTPTPLTSPPTSQPLQDSFVEGDKLKPNGLTLSPPMNNSSSFGSNSSATRRRSISVGGGVSTGPGNETWKFDVEDLLDNIVGQTETGDTTSSKFSAEEKARIASSASSPDSSRVLTSSVNSMSLRMASIGLGRQDDNFSATPTKTTPSETNSSRPSGAISSLNASPAVPSNSSPILMPSNPLMKSPVALTDEVIVLSSTSSPSQKASSTINSPALLNSKIESPVVINSPLSATSTTMSSTRSTVDVSVPTPTIDSTPFATPTPAPEELPMVTEVVVEEEVPPVQTIRLVPSSPFPGQSPKLPNIDDTAGSIPPPPPTTVVSTTTTVLGLGVASNSEDLAENIEKQGQEAAMKILNGDEGFRAKDKVAEYLGGRAPVNVVALKHYMNDFDFTGMRLDNALRHLTSKLYFRAETQELDRIIVQFSQRYFNCNPMSLFGSASIVHSVAYSLLLLNTDLHIADVQNHMSRQQFIKNTLSVIQSEVRDQNASANHSARSSTPDLVTDDGSSSLRGHDVFFDAPSSSTTGVSFFESPKSKSRRSGSMTSLNRMSLFGNPANSASQVSQSGITTHANSSSSSIPQPAGILGGESRPKIQHHAVSSVSAVSSHVSKAWDTDLEATLKDMYNALKAQEILQPTGDALVPPSRSSLTLSPGSLSRRQSVRSNGPDRVNALKRGSIRGIQSLLGTQPQKGNSPYGTWATAVSSDGRISPTPSYATSIGDVSMAVAPPPPASTAPTFGFVTNLSHTIIKEQEDETRSITSDATSSTIDEISDEELALLGAPWAKEGMLTRKAYWDAKGKRSKDKAWRELFVVVQKGSMKTFTFGDGGDGNRGLMGGGNWLTNATLVSEISLAHVLASPLPPPGYNSSRPYVFAVHCPNESITFFQAGTEELVNEWVSTCNYWSARTSKEPLTGGVSNMEYGWGQASDIDSDRASYRGHSDRIFVNEWKPQIPSTIASTLDEEYQLEALVRYAGKLQIEKDEHRAMEKRLLPSRSIHGPKARENYTKKLNYLTAEIARYATYIEALRQGIALRLQRRGQLKLDASLKRNRHSLSANSQGLRSAVSVASKDLP